MQNPSGVGVVRQSALDKAKAADKARKLRDEKEAASALEEFVKEFDADVSDETSTWRAGGVEGGITHTSSHGAGARVSMPGRRHFTGPPKRVEEAVRGGKKRNLDSFLEEIKRDHAERDSREQYARYNAGDSVFSQERLESEMSASTLSLACLPLSTRQSQLRQLLSPHGDIQSIKIHTDRSSSSREFTRKSATALVTFSKPYETEKAQSAVDGHYLGEGFRIKASWGDKQAKGKDVVGAPFNAGTRSESLTKAQLSRAPPPSSLLVPANVPKWGQSQQLVVRVERPRDPRMLRRIHAVIESVSEYGTEFEALLMEREKGNENYAFLFDSNLPEAQYYRWKAYSLKNGDSPYSWRTEPFQMFVDGEWWIPPEQVPEDDDEVRDDPDEEEARLLNRVRGFLGLSGQKKLLWLLRRVDGRRGSVARGMAYAMDRADAAEEIVDMILASICSDDTPLPKKISRLHLIHDILHNSSSGRANVWKYRQLFESRLNVVFEYLHTIYTSFDGRIKADNFRRQVMAVTSVWETWMIFNNSNVEGWVKTFLGQVGGEEEMMETNIEEVVEQPVEKKGRWNSVADTSRKSAEITDVENVEEEIAEGEDEDVDGMPIEEEDVDGEPMEEDVDGEPMEEEDVDGQPMDEDGLDGMPMEETPQLPPVVSPDSSPQERIRQEPPRPDAANRAEPVNENEVPRPQKRQRMRAVDMFTDD